MAQHPIFDSIEITLFDDDNYSIGDPNGKLQFVLGMHDNGYNSDDEEVKAGDVVTYQMCAALDGKFWLTFVGDLHSVDELSSLYNAVRYRKDTKFEFTDKSKEFISITYRTNDGTKTLRLRNIEDDTISCLKTYFKENRLNRAETKVTMLEQQIAELTNRLAKYETV